MKICLPTRVHQAGILMVLVCGGRAFIDSDWLLQEALDLVEQLAYVSNPKLEMVILQGGASGADFIARRWAYDNELRYVTEPAEWTAYGKAAGPKRNQLMIDKHHPDLCIAAPGGPGTADMVSRCRAANIPVYTLDGAADGSD